MAKNEQSRTSPLSTSQALRRVIMSAGILIAAPPLCELSEWANGRTQSGLSGAQEIACFSIQEGLATTQAILNFAGINLRLKYNCWDEWRK